MCDFRETVLAQIRLPIRYVSSAQLLVVVFHDWVADLEQRIGKANWGQPD